LIPEIKEDLPLYDIQEKIKNYIKNENAY
jgi:hypothetical protein